ncbi:hypothetical protein LC608_17920 [Nostoc sp. XA010]|uniref:hypothetical protein n=1 Tax=Nostoc sp. XA010 TaxID=2780407 RepID=UPI001E37EE9B|nr:hypothetical protein [Nostoc sp. XA010]MCC5658828.1 hypothetical protein [Nostoc sp. XA010]
MRQNLLVSFLRFLLLSYQASKLKPITKTVSIAALNQINWYKAKLLKKELSSQNKGLPIKKIINRCVGRGAGGREQGEKNARILGRGADGAV